jgi:hypothetical protein
MTQDPGGDDGSPAGPTDPDVTGGLPLPPLPPLLPPPPPWMAVAAMRPRVSDAVLAIPLGPRRLVGQALDLLTRPDAGLRSASFYIGFLLLATAGPAIGLLGVALLALPGDPFGRPVPGDPAAYRETAWSLWLTLALLPASFGYLAAGVEARALAVAVIGGRAEGRPLRLRESIAVARRRFWSILGAQLLVGLVGGVASLVASLVVGRFVHSVDAVSFAVSILVGLVVGAPFVYVPAGIVLGEAPAVEAIRRSIRLARARKRLAVVVTLFTLASQVLVVFGLSSGADVVERLVGGTGLADSFPVPLVIPAAAALVFAVGTLQFLVEAIAAAPAVHAFEALTHYTAGLELGRREPLAIRHAWDPWFTPGLAACAALALLALVAGVLTIAG